jgi:hypothetical protein
MATEQNVKDFLQRLLSDRAFKDKLKNNPQDALNEYSIDIPQTLPPAVQVPSDKRIKAFLSAIQQGYVGEPESVLGFSVLSFVLGGPPTPPHD